MTWTYQYDEYADETEIYYDDDIVGTIDGEITSWSGRLPTGDSKEIVLDAVENPMTASLLYGFEEIREDQDEKKDGE